MCKQVSIGFFGYYFICRAQKHPGEIDKKVSFANKSVQLFNLHPKLVKK